MHAAMTRRQRASIALAVILGCQVGIAITHPSLESGLFVVLTAGVVGLHWFGT